MNEELLLELLALLVPYVQLLLDYVNPVIAGMSASFAPFVFRLIYLVFKQDLHNLTKMAIVTLIGGFIGVAMFIDGKAFETSVEAVTIGLISGASATGAFASIQKILKSKKEEVVLQFQKTTEEPYPV
jgi:signal transduction histidine kinase